MLHQTEWRSRTSREGFTSPEVNAAVDKIVAHIEEQPAGGSADAMTGTLYDFVDGYLVGGASPSSVLLWPVHRPISEARAQIQMIVQQCRNTRGHKLFVGWWTDGDTIYVEASQHFTMLTRAFSTATQRGELAFYDVAAGKDIRL